MIVNNIKKDDGSPVIGFGLVLLLVVVHPRTMYIGRNATGMMKYVFFSGNAQCSLIGLFL